MGELMPTVAKVWIEEDCITCDACQDILPEVFEVTDDTSHIKADVREDGGFDRNTGLSAIKAEFRAEYSELIEEAADACPVEIIKFEYEAGAVEVVAEVAPAAEMAVAPPAAVADTGADTGVLGDLMSGDRSLAIFFGSQTGNAAELAEKTAKKAVAYGLEPQVIDMDGYDESQFSNHKRILIITSTWGEGEMPDNAENLWNSTNANNPSLKGVHHSVCAIGDSSYDEFCKAGTDWDDKFKALGATEILKIQLCDVDYETPWLEWVDEVLPRIACVNSTGVFEEDLLEAMIAYGVGDEEDDLDSDYNAPDITRAVISVTMKIFRYNPALAESGYDTIAVALPGHATIEDSLIAIKRDLDGSLTFRCGGIAGHNPLTGVKANGRILPADTTMISDLVSDGDTLTIEPVPGYEVLKDLMVSYDRYEAARVKSKPWMEADPRQGESLANGSAMGVMTSAEATNLHTLADVGSLQLINSMSDTYDVDEGYDGPGIALQRWVRSQDPRSGKRHVKQMFDLMQGKEESGLKLTFHLFRGTVLMAHKQPTPFTLPDQGYSLNTNSQERAEG